MELHALIDKITTYPDRKMEVTFRIREREKKAAGGDNYYPHQSTYPLGGLPLMGVSYNYVHTWQYIPPSLRV